MVDREIAPLTAKEFDAFRQLILAEAGVALSEAKREMLCSRLSRRLRHLGLTSYGDYYRYVEEQGPDGEERQQLINCITTNKTDFFREPHHFDFLRDNVLAARGQLGPRGRRLRIWSAGCSTGEEPYTLAMSVMESAGSLAGWDVRILASDIDTDVLARAERGIYSEDRVGDVPAELKRRYFLRGTGRNAGTVLVRPELRDLVSFRQINLIQEPWPIRGQFDAIFCRNVMIYFNRPTQQRLLEGFAAHLNPDGYLFVGHSENLQWLSNLFEPVGGTVYRLPRREVARPTPSGPLSGEAARSPSALLESESVLEDHTVTIGDVTASHRPAVLKTLLGSCVSACLFDPHAGIGGMNHFSLPDEPSDERVCTRYGVHAMELLINEVMKRGGDRRRLQAKVFGGARVLDVDSELLNIGQRNARFVLDFLHTEGITVVSKCLGGPSGLRVHFYSHSGRALVKPLDGRLLTDVADDEERYRRDVLRQLVNRRGTDVTLF
jgi:chemotaxis protein methyltransferase CheR